MKTYKIKEFAILIGTSVSSLRRWDSDGIFVAYRTPKLTRYYTHDQYLEYLRQQQTSPTQKVV